MKKIVVCIALAIISMMSAAASFLVNDAPAYRNWAQVNRPKIMETFGRDRKAGQNAPARCPPRKGRPARAHDGTTKPEVGCQKPSSG